MITGMQYMEGMREGFYSSPFAWEIGEAGPIDAPWLMAAGSFYSYECVSAKLRPQCFSQPRTVVRAG